MIIILYINVLYKSLNTITIVYQNFIFTWFINSFNLFHSFYIYIDLIFNILHSFFNLKKNLSLKFNIKLFFITFLIFFNINYIII